MLASLAAYGSGSSEDGSDSDEEMTAKESEATGKNKRQLSTSVRAAFFSTR
jgi:hypothetical protein